MNYELGITAIRIKPHNKPYRNGAYNVSELTNLFINGRTSQNVVSVYVQTLLHKGGSGVAEQLEPSPLAPKVPSGAAPQ